MKNLRGFAFLSLVIVIAVMATLSATAIYVVKKNPNVFFPSTQTQKDAEKGAPAEETSGNSAPEKEKSMAEIFLDMVGQKIKSIITPSAPIGNLTPVRDLRGTWVSSLGGKGIQTYSQFKTGPGTTQIYQEGDIELIINSMDSNTASGTMRYINLCTWGRSTAPKIPTINIPKKCVSTPANPIQIRVSGSRLDFGTVSAGGANVTMQGNYTTDLISGTTTATISPYGVVKGEFHLIRKQ
jgi:hypothetical protein